MRSKKDAELLKGMCARFQSAMRELDLTAAELARALGYSNATTISKVQRGEAFVDVERLYKLAQLRTPSGRQIDLNWLITGDEQKDLTP